VEISEERMRRSGTIVTVCVLGIVAGATILADERPTAAYQKAMKDLGTANQALRAEVKIIESAGAYPDYTTLDKHVTVLRSAFTATLA
jgi:hypothetical protein